MERQRSSRLKKDIKLSFDLSYTDPHLSIKQPMGRLMQALPYVSQAFLPKPLPCLMIINLPNPMSYTEVPVNPIIEQKWHHITLILDQYPLLHGKVSDPHMEKVWMLQGKGQDTFYQFQFRSGHFPHHYHFTIIVEINYGQVKILNAAIGYTTIF